MTILIDSGATYNYIRTNCDIGEPVPLNETYTPKTLHGHSKVNSKKLINILNYDLTFFEINELVDFDMILGEQGLRQMRATINFSEYKLYYYENPCASHRINYTIDNLIFENEITNLMKENESISENIPMTTTIECTIRTINNDPIYTKQYPYPYSNKEFVDSEIKKLLENDVIEKSFSPYNAPIWVVPKKGLDENNKPKKRLVIDFQKLNEQTITDKFPIPDINLMIQNLGRAKVFSTIDLESGYHQISIKRDDREKTAFSINHAKYQFKRMPFGLKNAPSIFQRCVNDILHKYIGKFAYVYVDDVLIFSETEEEHMQHISLVVQALHEANMKISSEKSHFFKNSIEFLGHIITHGKITVDPQKIMAIRDYEMPKTLKQLRSFLGLSGYYRKFIKDYAKITKPLTHFLRGENGMVKANQSSRIKIELDQAAIDAFHRIKILLQEQVELFQPDFNEPFDLTTDASNFAIGAVLSQSKRPIVFISRTLNQTEQNYATNEKEILAIVWALQKLRNYLYGIADLTIYTDHQSLTHSISEKNPNTKLKRWKNFIAEFGASIKYKPGHQNIVADALSRHFNQINITNANDTISPMKKIKKTRFPLNRFKNQLEIFKSDHDSLTSKIVFDNFQNHEINFTSMVKLINNLSLTVSKKHLNAIHSTEEIFHSIERSIIDAFPNSEFIFTTNKVTNVINPDEQLQVVMEIHNRAHRNAINNFLETQYIHFWPNMKKDFNEYVKACEICKTQKYERTPIKQPIGVTPIPERVGESISMDLFFIDGKTYVTSVDRYSKYLVVHPLESKTNFHIKLEEILTQSYPDCQTVITDNENIFNSRDSRMVFQKYDVVHISTPVQHSTSNGVVERTHSTLIEIIRCLKAQSNSSASDEIYNAVKAYNETIHSVTNEKPADMKRNPMGYSNIRSRIMNQQESALLYHNRERKNRDFMPNEVIYVKTDRRRKDVNAYNKHVVKQDLGNTVRTTTGKIYHKDNIRVNRK